MPETPKSILTVECTAERPAVLATGRPFSQMGLLVSVSVNSKSGSAIAPPARLLVVVDTSSSMRGEKLDLVKSAVVALMEALGPADEIGLAAFDSTFRLLIAPHRADDMHLRRIRTTVNDLGTGVGTNLGEALLGTFSAVRRLPPAVPGAHTTVLLLSDGLPSTGHIVESDELVSLVTTFRPAGLTLSTFGYGSHADSALLSELANKGGGRYTPARSLVSIVEGFNAEFLGQRSVAAREVSIKLKGTKFTCKSFVGDLIRSVPKTKVFTVPIPKGKAGQSSPFALVRVSARLEDGETSLVEVSVPVRFVVLDGEQSPSDPRVIARMDDEIVQNVILAAAPLAERHQFAEVDELFMEAERRAVLPETCELLKKLRLTYGSKYREPSSIILRDEIISRVSQVGTLIKRTEP